MFNEGLALEESKGVADTLSTMCGAAYRVNGVLAIKQEWGDIERCNKY